MELLDLCVCHVVEVGVRRARPFLGLSSATITRATVTDDGALVLVAESHRLTVSGEAASYTGGEPWWLGPVQDPGASSREPRPRADRGAATTGDGTSSDVVPGLVSTEDEAGRHA